MLNKPGKLTGAHFTNVSSIISAKPMIMFSQGMMQLHHFENNGQWHYEGNMPSVYKTFPQVRIGFGRVNIQSLEGETMPVIVSLVFIPQLNLLRIVEQKDRICDCGHANMSMATKCQACGKEFKRSRVEGKLQTTGFTLGKSKLSTDHYHDIMDLFIELYSNKSIKIGGEHDGKEAFGAYNLYPGLSDEAKATQTQIFAEAAKKLNDLRKKGLLRTLVRTEFEVYKEQLALDAVNAPKSEDC